MTKGDIHTVPRSVVYVSALSLVEERVVDRLVDETPNVRRAELQPEES